MKLRTALREHAPDVLAEWDRHRRAQGQPVPEDGETVARFRSRTHNATSYRVSRGRGGALACECPSYEYRGTCAHTRAAATVYGATRTLRRSEKSRHTRTSREGSGGGGAR